METEDKTPLDELRELVVDVTPLPWGITPNGVHIRSANGVIVLASERPDVQARIDLAFVVTACNLVVAMTNDWDEMRARVEDMTAQRNIMAREVKAATKRAEAAEASAKEAGIHDANLVDRLKMEGMVLKSQLAAAVARAEAAEAKLALVDEYGRYCHDSAVFDNERLPWPYTSFDEWLAMRNPQGEVQP